MKEIYVQQEEKNTTHQNEKHLRNRVTRMAPTATKCGARASIYIGGNSLQEKTIAKHIFLMIAH